MLLLEIVKMEIDIYMMKMEIYYVKKILWEIKFYDFKINQCYKYKTKNSHNQKTESG